MNDTHSGGPPPHPFAQDIALRDRIVAGDANLAYDLLRNEYSKKFHRIVKRYGLEREYPVDDLIQDIFLQWSAKNWQALRLWEARCSLSSWASGAAIQLCKNARKKHKGRDDLLEKWSQDALTPGDSPDPELAIIDAQSRFNMMQAVEALANPSERLLFKWLVFDELRIPEIAQRLGMARKDVDSLKFRAKPRLMTELLKRGVQR